MEGPVKNSAVIEQARELLRDTAPAFYNAHANDMLTVIWDLQKRENPPIGVMPRWVVRERRVQELARVIVDYKLAGKDPLPEWFEELKQL